MSQELIAERYEVLKELGQGGVGRVVLARDGQLDRKVAVKTLLKAGRAEDRARFVEEARINGQLTHPNVVTIHSLGVHRDELYMVMKLVEGRDLKQIRQGLAAGDETIQRDWPLRRLLRLYLQVCEAVGYAHSRGVIHRDLKPANVMVTDDDEVLLLDWGLAKPVEEGMANPAGEQSFVDNEAIRSRLRSSIATSRSNALALIIGGDASEADGELTMQGQIVGTPAYMPPEQADSSAGLDARSDVYSLGTILYELLAHRAPYTGSTYSCLKALIEGPPQRPSQAAPGNEVPPQVEAIVLKAMARTPGERYSDAASLAADVAAYLDGGRVGAYEESAGEAIRRWVRQNTVAAGALLSGFLLVNVLILIAAALVLDEERVADEAKIALKAAEEESVRLGAQAKSSAGLVELAGQGEERVGRALELVASFSEAIREATPIAASERNSARAQTLFDLHLEFSKEVGLLAQAQAGIATEWEALGGGPTELVALQAPLREARSTLDRLLVSGLISRRPSLALHLLFLPNPPRVPAGVLPEPLPELELGAAGDLLRSRALWRA
ncbi:MAG: serine/threonine protein kinase, partial [Planctomycetes bacterium]|nr:serine/threonine protein kinase [Planctomycetota bacterium]